MTVITVFIVPSVLANKKYIGNIAKQTLIITIISPASLSPELLLKINRNNFSSIFIIIPINFTGCGKKYGSPKIQSSTTATTTKITVPFPSLSIPYPKHFPHLWLVSQFLNLYPHRIPVLFFPCFHLLENLHLLNCNDRMG